ncbi:MAG TPA: DUF1186 domain-containing protein [Bacteroidales bacterium]|nr:DUF1186 domain-containing protein [Bacteroidales bacterium]
MGEQFKISGYNITTDPEFQNKKFGISPELFRQLESLYYESQDKKNKTVVDKLTQLILQYPGVPQLKNYLSAAYKAQGNYQKALEVNQWILAEHPDYLFGLLNQANIFIDNKEFEKVPGVLGEAMEIKQLYPERDLFHLAEITGFLLVCVRYYTAIENLELAENRFDLLKDIAPDHPDTDSALKFICTLRLKTAAGRWLEEQKNKILPASSKQPPETEYSIAPSFTHPEIQYLYEYGLDIPHEKLHQILEIPHYSLAADLEKILEDAVKRYTYFKHIGWQEDTHTFVLHAMFLLKEINSTNSLSEIFSFLEYDDDFLDFWIGDHITATVWQCFYGLGFHKTSELGKFLVQPNIETYCKTSVSEALCQIALHHPERRNEIIEIFSDVFSRFSEARIEDNLIDSDCIGLLICDAMDANLHELLPIIKTLFDKGYVAVDICGVYKKVEEEMLHPLEKNNKKELKNIFELYDHVLNTWAGYTDDESYSNDFDDEYTPVETTVCPQEPKIGRNAPCPCGSGKKYKKCCMNL